MSTDLPALQIEQVSHSYGLKQALSDVSLTVNAGEFLTLLGPNGSGKSTLFRLICTLAPIQEGRIDVMGINLANDPASVRKQLGVIFQNPALDKQLTVRENLYCHATLYGLDRQTIRRRADDLLDRFGLLPHIDEIVMTFSGGMRRRVELVKALMTEPSLLIMDEPSTGLDLHARNEFWRLVQDIRQRKLMSILLITHLMEEAENCDRVAIIDRSRLITTGTPTELRTQVGGDVINFTGQYVNQLKAIIEEQFKLPVKRIGNQLRIEHHDAHLLVPKMIEAVPGMIESISISRPTLDDVFVHLTGRSILSELEE